MAEISSKIAPNLEPIITICKELNDIIQNPKSGDTKVEPYTLSLEKAKKLVTTREFLQRKKNFFTKIDFHQLFVAHVCTHLVKNNDELNEKFPKLYTKVRELGLNKDSWQTLLHCIKSAFPSVESKELQTVLESYKSVRILTKRARRAILWEQFKNKKDDPFFNRLNAITQLALVLESYASDFDIDPGQLTTGLTETTRLIASKSFSKKETIDFVASQPEALEVKLAQILSQIGTQEESVKQAAETHIAATVALGEMSKIVLEKQAILATLLEPLTKASTLLEEANKQAAQEKQQIEQSTSQISTLKEEIQVISASIDADESQFAEKNTAIAELEQLLAQANQKVVETETTQKTTERNYQEAQIAFENAKKQTEHSSTEEALAQQNATEEQQKAQETLEKTKHALDEACSVQEQAKLAQQQAEQDLLESRNTLVELQKSNARKLEEKTSLEQKLQSTKQALEKANEQAEATKKKIESAQQEVNSQTETLREPRKQPDAALQEAILHETKAKAKVEELLLESQDAQRELTALRQAQSDSEIALRKEEILPSALIQTLLKLFKLKIKEAELEVNTKAPESINSSKESLLEFCQRNFPSNCYDDKLGVQVRLEELLSLPKQQVLAWVGAMAILYHRGDFSLKSYNIQLVPAYSYFERKLSENGTSSETVLRPIVEKFLHKHKSVIDIEDILTPMQNVFRLFANFRKHLETKRDIIYIVGDSVTSGACADIGSYNLHAAAELFQKDPKKYSPAQCYFVNSSIVGDSISKRENNSFRSFDAGIKLHRPKVVIWNLGGNDIVNGTSIQTIREQLKNVLRVCNNNSVQHVVISFDVLEGFGKETSMRHRLQELFDQINSAKAKKTSKPEDFSLYGGLNDLISGSHAVTGLEPQHPFSDCCTNILSVTARTLSPKMIVKENTPDGIHFKDTVECVDITINIIEKTRSITSLYDSSMKPAYPISDSPENENSVKPSNRLAQVTLSPE